jgi:hypothetical protein
MTGLAPWFRAGTGDTEPFSYRAWKWGLQQALTLTSWNHDLFDRLRQTDWDVVLILDSCRYDVLADVATEAAIERACSPATATQQFLERAAADGVFNESTYISANPQTSRQVPGDGVDLVNVHESGWDDSLNTVPPEVVYDEVRRRVDSNGQVVAHTVQPHYPHICEFGGRLRAVPNGLHPTELGLAGDSEGGLQIQDYLARGAVDLDLARRSYRAAVKYAWEQARNLAAELAEEGYTTVVTADHGELFGEWGLVEHPVDIPVAGLVEVPWLFVRPRGRSADASVPEESVDERLAALGYVE